jgi:predicted thioredoxin/glutaredoxin
MFMWLLSYTADGELRICIPMSDVIHGQVDEGVKMLLDTGGEVTQKRSYCRNEQMTISALRHRLHEV